MSDRDGDGEIYVMNADGSGVMQLTHNNVNDGYPSWSPDGSQIAFRSEQGGGLGIYIMNVDGTNQTYLTSVSSGGGDGTSDWSPDGTRIVFQRNIGQQDIFVINVDGTNEQQLTFSLLDDNEPKWSPDGTQIVFGSRRGAGNNFDIWLMDVDGSNQHSLTDTGTRETRPDWSADGTQIVFTSDRDGNEEIYVMSADGTNPTRSTINSASDRRPVWSPDDAYILFTSDRDGNEEIYMMNADGANLVNLTNSSGYDSYAVWQPTPPDDLDDDAVGDDTPADTIVTVFDPAISKIGVLPPGQLGLPGEQITWEITVTNTGNAPGSDVMVTDTLIPELRIDAVTTSKGTYTINGQTIVFAVGDLAPQETVLLRIVTTVLTSSVDSVIVNRAELSAANLSGIVIVEAALTIPYSLPSTGYQPGS